MAYYQSTDILKEFQLKGSFKVEYAPYALDHTSATWVEVGMADAVSFVETAEFLEGNAQNAAKPDINTGIAKQTLAIGFEPWALDITNYMAMRGGIDVLVTNATGTTAGQTQVFSGGGTETTAIMLKLTNRRITKATAADVAQYTGISGLAVGDAIYRDVACIGFKCTITSGANITGKNDDDTDAAMRFPFTFEGIEDTARDVYKQLSVIERSITVIT